jgi:hypothetical protein
MDANSGKAGDCDRAGILRVGNSEGARSSTPRLCNYPLNSNAITLTYSYYTGGLQFDGAVPITGATAQLSVPVFTY